MSLDPNANGQYKHPHVYSRADQNRTDQGCKQELVLVLVGTCIVGMDASKIVPRC